MVKKVLFIINPIAGSKNKKKLPLLIESEIGSEIPYKIAYWEDSGQDFNQLINENADADTDVIAAIGGDGTINRIAGQLVNTDLALAIIPIGSGNGIARHLGIPLRVKNALSIIKTGKIVSIDVCQMNDRIFVTTAGVGFDAYISHLFTTSKKRGFISYFYHSLKAILTYKSKKYILKFDNRKIKEKAFLITFANASQWGNNVFIAPDASITDGYLDVVIIKAPNFFSAIEIAYRLFNKTVNKSRSVRTFRVKEIMLKRKSIKLVHYDGESDRMSKKIYFRVLPLSLRVIVPNHLKF